MAAKLLQWIDRLIHRRGAAALPRLTARTSPPTCPVCRGAGRVQVGTIACACGCGCKVPVLQLCGACGLAGVVPAAVLARDAGDSRALRAYVGAFRDN